MTTRSAINEKLKGYQWKKSNDESKAELRDQYNRLESYIRITSGKWSIFTATDQEITHFESLSNAIEYAEKLSVQKILKQESQVQGKRLLTQWFDDEESD